MPTGKHKPVIPLPVSLGAWPKSTPSRFVWVLPYVYREAKLGTVLSSLAKLLRAFAHGWRLAASHNSEPTNAQAVAERQRKQLLIAIAVEDAAALLEQRAFRDFESQEE